MIDKLNRALEAWKASGLPLPGDGLRYMDLEDVGKYLALQVIKNPEAGYQKILEAMYEEPKKKKLAPGLCMHSPSWLGINHSGVAGRIWAQ